MAKERCGYIYRPKYKARDGRYKESLIWKAQARRQAYMLASRYNREQLYEEVWSKPVLAVARRSGLSDVGLAKICKKLNIPQPARGYWAKNSAGRAVGQRPALPQLGKWN